MKAFLSFASPDRSIAEAIQLALLGAGHEVFFDAANLPAGSDYNSRIRKALNESDVFIFLISPDSVGDRRYAHTELKLAKAKWPRPWGVVLPVMIRATEHDKIDPYLTAVTILEPHGNIAAEVADAIAALPNLSDVKATDTDSLLGVGVSRRSVKWLGIVGLIASVIVTLYFLPSNRSSAPPQSVHVPGSEGIGVIAGRDVTVTVNPKQHEQAKSTDPRLHLLVGTWKGVHRRAVSNGKLIFTGYTGILESGSYTESGEASFQSTTNGRLTEVIFLCQSAGTWKLYGNKFAVTLADFKAQSKVLKVEGQPDIDLSNPLTFPVHLIPKWEDTIPRGSSMEYEIVELTPSTFKVRGKDLRGIEVFFEGVRQ